MTNKLQNVGKYIAPAVFLCVLGGLMWYQSHQHHGYYNSGYRSVMGTFAQVTVAAASEEQAHSFITAAFAEMDKVNRIMNDWDPNSEISQLTQTAYPEPKVVSPELFEVIAASVEYSKLSEGAFDITVGPETQLWRQMQKTGQKPSPEALTTARAKVGYEKVTLNPAEKTVQFAVEGMKLDVGAIAKGYAVDIAMEAMRTQGAVAGMVDLGGNVRCFGPGPAGGNWYIGLRDPRHTEKTLIKLRLNEMAVATSGDYERYAVVDGQPQSHILNPKTSESVKELASVTIIAPTAMQADALSTAVSVLGKEKGLALIEKIPGVEAIVMTSAQPDQRIETPGAKQFIEMD
ncbi:FAD:protein FMN transferase [Anaerohalosphaeraceae bacterium U12dextr]